MTQKSLTRRQFLKGSAMGAAGLAFYGCFGMNILSAAATPAEIPAPANPFDFEKRTVLLNNGVEMPIVGLGTFNLIRNQAVNSTYWALKAGHRLIDTAYAYGNEKYVGQGIRQAIEEGICKREDIFVTSKLWYDGGYNAEGIESSLNRLGLDYIDLLLLHQPQNDYIGGYLAMEEAVHQGKLRCIGVSNFSKNQMEKLIEAASIMPAVHQIETHLHHQQEPMTEYLRDRGITYESWFPFGGKTHAAEFLAIPEVVEIANAHGKLPAQVMIRWHLQNGHVCFPGSTNEEHIRQNYDVFDFSLSDEEMALLSTLNRNEPYFPGMGDTEDEVSATSESWSKDWGLETSYDSKKDE